ncbi:MAG: ATP-binding protein [Gemmatimonadota bacterium]
MRVTHKLYASTMGGLLLVIVPFGLFSYEREVRQFEADMGRDAGQLGTSLAVAARDALEEGGGAGGRQLVADLNRGAPTFRIRWVSLLPEAAPVDRPHVQVEDLRQRLARGPVSVRQQLGTGGTALLTYVAVGSGPGLPQLALELAEDMAPLFQYARRSIWRLVAMAGALLLTAAVLTGAAGRWLIGRPIEALEAHAARIGAGDLEARLELRSGDEIAGLGRSMNAMSGQLKLARDRLVQESGERIRALEQLRHTDRLATVGRLSSGLAHELGTPLNVVSGRAKLIGGGLEPEAVAESARTIGEQAERMARIIRQLLDFARARPAQKAPADAGQLLERVARLLEPMARKQAVILEVAAAADLPPVVVDAMQMEQVLINLAVNGIQAMPDGGRLGLGAGHVRRAAPAAGGVEAPWLAMTVEDGGAGIPPENREAIFDPFFTTKEVGQGTGLGLSIAYGIVREHGGWIEVASEVGKGSCFTVYLPAGEAA